ncbi:MAG: flagellar hook-length control protein FliK [Thermodesulfobacteriota bacterium]
MQFLPTFILSAGSEGRAKAGFGAVREQASSSFSELLGRASATARGAGRRQACDVLEAKASALSAEGREALALARGLLAKEGAAGSGDAAAEHSGRARKVLSALFVAVGGGGRKPDLSLQGLALTREDFAALREGLAEHGFTAAELEQLQSLVNSKGGLTWGRLVSAVARKMAGLDAFPAELSGDEIRAIQSFFQKAGCTPQEAEGLLDKLRRGEAPVVWQVLEGKLAALPEGSALDLDKAEIEALSRALRLDSGQQGRLRSAIAEDGSARLAVKDLKAVLAELKTDAAQRAADRSSQATALRDLVAGVYESARDKAGVDAKADRRPDGEARRTRLLAEAAKDERQAEEDGYRPLSGKDAAGESEGRGLAARLPGHDRSRTAEDGRQQGERNGRGEHGENKAPEGAAPNQARPAAQTEEQKAWAEFWGKVAKDRAASAQVRAEARPPAGDAAAGLAGEASAALRAEAPQASPSSGLEKFAPRDVLRQVESGVFRNLSEGAKQLTLRLDPPELGKLSLQLTVRGQDVSVVLKAETAEAGRMLSENLPQLRQVLEDQGLKVGKLEVQTQLSGGEQGRDWAGADRHNEAREREEAARALDRMRILRGGETVAREMQSGDVTAIHSHTGLSVIA